MGTRPFSEEKHTMTMMNDTMETFGSAVDSAKSTVGSAVDTAKHSVDSAKKGTERAASVAFSDIIGGIRTVTEAFAMIRRFGVDDALGWIGLSRRRNRFDSVAIFGSGVLVGAGVGVLLAPMAGSDLRKVIIKRLRGVEKDAEKVAGKMKDAVVNAEHKIEDAAGKVKDAVVNAEHKVEDAAGKAKDALTGAEHKVEDAAGKAKDAVVNTEHKVGDAAGKAKDALAGAERRNNSASTDGHRRAAESVTAK
jgi:gas vesicle protein